jgi:hypothetical protein
LQAAVEFDLIICSFVEPLISGSFAEIPVYDVEAGSTSSPSVAELELGRKASATVSGNR